MSDPVTAAVAIGGGSIIGGILGADAQKDAAETAANAQTASTNAQIAEAQRQYNLNRQDFSPYMAAGYQGLAGLTGQTQTFTDPTTGQVTTYQGNQLSRTVDPFTGEQMSLPSYSSMVTDQLSNYANDPQVAAQKALAQKELARQQAARGLAPSATSANAAAELGMKYDTTGYDRYQSQLQNAYSNAMSEFGTKYGINSDKITDLQNLTKIGQNAAGTISSSGQNTSNAINQALQAQGSQAAASALQSGAAQGSFYSGLGNVIPSAISSYNSASSLFNNTGNTGWFNTAASNPSTYEFSGGYSAPTTGLLGVGTLQSNY